MLGCTHIDGAVDLKTIKKALLKSDFNIDECKKCKTGKNTPSNDLKIDAYDREYVYSSLWMCLKCGHQGCSRQKNQHALQHFSASRFGLQYHSLSVNTTIWSVWCYACNDYVDAYPKKLLESVQYLQKQKHTENSKQRNDPSVSKTEDKDLCRKMDELTIPDAILKKFRCSVCKHYLSSAPVKILPNGRNICNICSPSTEQPTYRQFAMESFLFKLRFPCQFKNYGCGVRVSFGQADQHENNCAYKVYVCPVGEGEHCSWKGSAVQIFQHFTAEHSELIKANAEFKLHVNQYQDQKGAFLFSFDEINFIINYIYSATSRNLKHDVRALPPIQGAAYKIQLTNDIDGDYSCTIKGGNVSPYDHRFYSMQHSKIVPLDNYMQVLNNPRCVRIATKVTVITKFSDDAQLFVDYELLKSVRCHACRGYLFPPLYYYEGSTICCRCRVKYPNAQPVHNEKLCARVAKTNFPCRWQGCGFIGKSQNVLNHEPACEFYVFKCKECKNTFTRAEALVHMRNHGYEYFRNTFTYKMVLEKPCPQKKIFTFKDNEFILLGYSNRSVKDCGEIDYIHDIDRLFTENRAETEFPNAEVEVEIEHDHCTVKSDTSTVRTGGIYVIIEFLPDCFKTHEELTVTLKI